VSVPDKARISAIGRIVTVSGKELTDTWRDRRTMLVTLLMALAAGPLFLALILNMAANQAEKARELRLPVDGAGYAPALIAFLERQQVAIVAAPPDYEARIRSGDLDVVLAIDAEFEQSVASGKPATVRLVYDRSRDRARAAIDSAESLLRAYNRQWGTQRLLLRGIAPQVASPLEVQGVDLATPQQSGALILFLVAYYGLFASLMGSIAVALDATAGERERGSLEPLLATPLSTLQLAVGKWLAIGVPFLFGSAEFVRFVAILLPLVMLLPAVLLYVGLRGRTLKEAQSNVSALVFVVSIVPVVQLFLQRKEPPLLLWVPVSSQYTLLTRALRGDAIPMVDWLQSALLPVLLAMLALAAAARLLRREDVFAGR
jgi:sodium transport system permease protein